jgi:hypothetical protein
MAKMTIDRVRVAVAKDGTVTVPDAEDMAVGQVVRDPETKMWVARVIAEDGKLGRVKTEHPSRQAAFGAILRARGIVKGS